MPSPAPWIRKQAPRAARRARILSHRALDRLRSRVRRPCPPSDSGPSTSADTAAVTVVVPVYNAMPYLRELLDSLVAQDLPPSEFEVVAVDDGSTDGGGKLLDAFAVRHPNIRVVHQANTGWPGGPRNVGIDASRAEFVFFADADDRLGPEALRRMVAYARTNDVDVLVPKMVGLGGRGVQDFLFRRTEKDAALRSIARSLAPQKLVRRSLLLDHGIRFPEGKVRLEDGLVLSRCYLASRRTSVLADYDYYHLRAREDGGNISSVRVVPEGYVRSVTRIARIYTDGAPDPETGRLLVLDLYRRKCLRFYEPRRFAKMKPAVQRSWLAAHADFVEEYLPAELEQQLGQVARAKTRLVRERDLEGMRALCADEPRLRPRTDVAAARWSGDDLWLELQVEPTGFETLSLRIGERGGRKAMAVPVEGAAEPGANGRVRMRAGIPLRELGLFGSGVVEVHTQAGRHDHVGDPVRVRSAPGLALPPMHGGAEPWTTPDGGFSIRLR